MHIAAVREKLITTACIYFSLRMLTLCRLLKGIKKKEQNCSLPVPLLLSHWQGANVTIGILHRNN